MHSTALLGGLKDEGGLEEEEEEEEEGGEGQQGRRRAAWGRFAWEHKSDALAMLLGPAISVPFAACHAALICSIPALQPHFPEVIQQITWTLFVGAVLSLFLGQFVTTTNMDPLVAILFGQMARNIQGRFGNDPEVFFPNMMVVMCLTTSCLGLVLYAVGRFRLAFMLRFLPYTVVGGFLAGCGMLILEESLALAAGVDLYALVCGTFDLSGHGLQTYGGRWLQMFLAILYAHAAGHAREAHQFGTPLLLVLCVFSALVLELGTAGAVPPQDWFLEFPEPVSWWAPFVSLAKGLSHFTLRSIHVELTLSFVTIMTVSWSINTLAVKNLVPLRRHLRRCDEQAEIQSLGLMNISLGALGCHASMQSFKIPMMMREVKAGDLWPVFNLMMSFTIFIASPRVIIRTVPRFLFAGTVVRLATDLIIEWLIEAKHRIAFKEWCVLALTAVMIAVNVSLGIVIGLFMTLVLFAVEYSSVTGIVKSGSLRETRSMVERNPDEHNLLQQFGQSVQILWLSGYFFFGSAVHVADEVRRLFEDTGVVIVVLDFSLVPAMDASGVYCLVDLIEEVQGLPQKSQLVFCGLVRRLENALRNAAGHKGVEVLMIHNLDSALEWCEGHLLAILAARGFRARSISNGMSRIDSCGAIAGVVGEGEEDTFAAFWERLLGDEYEELDPKGLSAQALQREVVARVVAAGQVVFNFGDPASEIVILIRGALEVTQPAEPDSAGETWHLPRHHLNAEKGDVFVFEEKKPRRVRRARRGAVFGAIEYAASCRAGGGAVLLQSSGTAVGTLELFVLPFDALRRIERAEPQVALVLRTWLSRLAADALLELRTPHRSCDEMPLASLHRSLGAGPRSRRIT